MDVEEVVWRWLRESCTCNGKVHSSLHRSTCPCAAVSEADIQALVYYIDEYVALEIDMALDEAASLVKERDTGNEDSGD